MIWKYFESLELLVTVFYTFIVSLKDTDMSLTDRDIHIQPSRSESKGKSVEVVSSTVAEHNVNAKTVFTSSHRQRLFHHRCSACLLGLSATKTANDRR